MVIEIETGIAVSPDVVGADLEATLASGCRPIKISDREPQRQEGHDLVVLGFVATGATLVTLFLIGALATPPFAVGILLVVGLLALREYPRHHKLQPEDIHAEASGR